MLTPLLDCQGVNVLTNLLSVVKWHNNSKRHLWHKQNCLRKKICLELCLDFEFHKATQQSFCHITWIQCRNKHDTYHICNASILTCNVYVKLFFWWHLLLSNSGDWLYVAHRSWSSRRLYASATIRRTFLVFFLLLMFRCSIEWNTTRSFSPSNWITSVPFSFLFRKVASSCFCMSGG